MRRVSRVIAGFVVATGLAFPACAQDAAPGLAQAFAHISLTPQQRLSLREFVGQFGRGAKIVPVIAADGSNIFELRDPQTNDRLGAFAAKQNADGSVWAMRIAGDADADPAHTLQLPLLANAKLKNEVATALAASAVGSGDPVSGFTNAPFLASQRVSAAVQGAQYLGQIAAAEGAFFQDGSGYVTALRGLATTASKPGAVAQTPPPLHLTTRYFTRIESDGAKLFRARTIEITGDAQASFADGEAGLVCANAGRCGPAWSKFVRPIIDNGHVLRRAKTPVSGATPELIAQLNPQPVQPVVSDPDITIQSGTPDSSATPATSPTGG